MTYTTVNETSEFILLAPVNKNTGKPRITGRIVKMKDTGLTFPEKA